jgi:hypothetical protein
MKGLLNFSFEGFCVLVDVGSPEATRINFSRPLTAPEFRVATRFSFLDDFCLFSPDVCS